MAKRFVFVLCVLFTIPALFAAELFEAIPQKFRAQAMSIGGENRGVHVKMNGDALPDADVTVPLGGVSYPVAYRNVECRGNGGVFPSAGSSCRNGEDYSVEFWFSSVGFPSVLTRHAGYVAGIISAPNGKVYEILPGAEGEVLRESHGRPECGVDAEFEAHSLSLAPTANQTPIRRRAVAHGPNYVVDLAEFWTPLAEAGAGGRAQMEVVVRSAVDILNSDTRQSDIKNLQFRLVYVGSVNHTEGTDSSASELSRFSQNLEVASVRNSTGADLCGIWTENDGAIANAPRSRGGFSPVSGFHKVGRRGGLSRHTYSHEVYHNFGGQHDAANVSAIAGEPYPFARDMCTQSWYTILSYGTCVPIGKDVPTIPYITNPDLNYNGVRLGDPNTMDNARMVRLSMGWVASYLPGEVTSKAP